MKYIFIILFCSCFYSQNPLNTWYDMNNALPQNSIKDIIKDKYGFIWIATENSIIQYDGSNFQTFNKFKVTDTHFGNFHGSIEKDSIVQFTILQKQQILIKNRHLTIPSHNLSTYTYTRHGEIYEVFNKNSINNSYSNDINYYIDLGSEQYFFYNGKKIIYVKKHSKKAILLHYQNTNNIFMNNNVLFIRNMYDKKMYAIKNGELKIVTAPDYFFNNENSIYWQQMNNQSFLIKDNKLYLIHYHGESLSLEYLFTYSDTERSFRHSIYYEKKSDKLFLGSLTKGLKIITLSDFIKPHGKKLNWDYAAYASLPYSDSTIISPKGIEIGRSGKISSYHFHNESDRYLMQYDDDKNILLPYSNTIVRMHKASNYKTHDVILFRNMKIKNLFKSKGFYFLAVSNAYGNNLLYIYKNDKFKEKYRTFSFNAQITNATAFSNNTILLSTTNSLYKISTENNTIQKIYSQLNIKYIIKDSDNDYWITTKNQGIFLLKSFKLIPVPLDKYEHLLSAHYILEDFHKNLWISSNNGLYKVSKKEVLESIEKNSTPNYYKYDTKNGLLNNEFNGGSTPNAYILKNKNFVFPSMEGFVIFNPDSIKTYYPEKNSMIIDRYRVDQEPIEFFKNRIKERSDYQHIEIFIDIPYYSNHENLQIEVKFDNHPWKYLKNTRKLDIFNLKPGKYKIIFRIFLGPELGYDYKKVDLEIVPFFYQTKTFSFILILFLISTVIFIIIIRTEILSKTNKQLKTTLDDKSKQLLVETEYQKKLMETISHDITTPVKFISLMIQKILQSHNLELQKEYLNSIYKSSEELYKFTCNLKEYSDIFKSPNNTIELCNIFEIVEEKILLFHEVANQKQITILNEVNLKCQANINKNIFNVILHNLIDNAVKYTEKGNIKIETRFINGDKEITIKDTGTGMRKEQLIFYNNLFLVTENNQTTLKNIGFGLQLVIQLVKKSNALISFENNTPHGTLVRITLKKNIYA